MLGPISPRIKNAQKLLKFSLIDISNMPISTLNSKINFLKYLPSVRPKLAQNAQNSLKFGLVNISNMLILLKFKSQKKFMKYLPSIMPKLVPKLKKLRIF